MAGVIDGMAQSTFIARGRAADKPGQDIFRGSGPPIAIKHSSSRYLRSPDPRSRPVSKSTSGASTTHVVHRPFREDVRRGPMSSRHAPALPGEGSLRRRGLSPWLIDGFMRPDTADVVRLRRNGRRHFAGRRGGSRSGWPDCRGGSPVRSFPSSRHSYGIGLARRTRSFGEFAVLHHVGGPRPWIRTIHVLTNGTVGTVVSISTSRVKGMNGSGSSASRT